MNEIVMPKLSDTMTEGRLVSWKKRVGDAVRRGDVLAEVETDKANMELEAFTAGTLLEIRVQPGEMAQVGTVIAVIGKPEEKGVAAPPQAAQPQPHPPEAEKAAQPAEAEKAPAAPPPKEKPAAAPPQPGAAAPPEAQVAPGGAPAQPRPGGEGEAQAPAAPQARAGEEQAPTRPVEDAEAKAAPAAPSGAPQAPAEVRERAAPVVRRRARELGIDLSQVKGSGPDGRILLQDLEGKKGRPAAPEKAPQAAPALEEGVKPFSRLRAAVGKAVSESWRSIPHFSVTMELLMDDAESVRRQLKQSGMAVTVNDLVVKAVALALQRFPQLNASYGTDGMHLRRDINIGIAVGVPEGVLMPVVQGCQRLSLQEIARTSRTLVERARSGSVTEQEISGGTFSVSNLGMYGVSDFSAVIFPAQAGVLAVGAVTDTVVVRNGLPAVAKVMKVTLSADHRLVDGAYAADFLAQLKEIMETPVRLLS